MRKNERLIGAAMERKALRRWGRVHAFQSRKLGSDVRIIVLADLEEYLDKRPGLYSKRKGGLGK